MSGGSKIFIGNIPYGVTDEVIIDILGRAGQVLNFRAMTDKDTGKPKGYGFAEFSDVDAAYSAVRNLNDFDLQGRKLKVDYANEKDARDPTGATSAHQHSGSQSNIQIPAQVQAPAQSQGNRLPTLPPGQDLQPGLTADDAISKTLQTLPVSQLLDILVQMQQLVANDPIQAQQLLDRSPQLSYAIFQALLNLNLVDPASLSTIIQAASAGPAPPPQSFQPPVPPAAAPPSYPPQPQYQQYPSQSYQSTPVPPTQAYQVPPAPPAQPAPTPEQQVLIQQVLSMSQEMIDALPPDQRQGIMMLRAQYAHYR